MDGFEEIVLKVYSDAEDSVSINSALAKLKNPNINVLLLNDKIFIEDYEILLINLSGIESNLIQQIVELRNL